MINARLIIIVSLLCLNIFVVFVGGLAAVEIGKSYNTIDNAINEYTAIVSDLGILEDSAFDALERRIFSTGGVYEIEVVVYRNIKSIGQEDGFLPIFEMSNTRTVNEDSKPNLRIGDEVRATVRTLSEGTIMEKTLKEVGIHVVSNEISSCVKVRNDGDVDAE